MLFVIFDIDGTLSDASGRLHHIDGETKDYPAFYKDCVYDTPHIPMIEICRMFRNRLGNRVEFWTGRPDTYRNETIDWLTKHGVPVREWEIKMRREGDYRHDYIVKEEWLHTESRKPDLVFEDRKQVTEMYRRHGIMVAQVAEGNF